MLKKPDILWNPMIRSAALTCHRQWQGILSCATININGEEQNFIKLSKQSALTVSQQLSINQQQEIGKTGLALAGSCQ